MMERLIARGGELAREAQLKRIDGFAERLRGMLGSAAAEIGEGQVSVRGRGILKRWLVDPALRFLGGARK